MHPNLHNLILPPCVYTEIESNRRVERATSFGQTFTEKSGKYAINGGCIWEGYVLNVYIYIFSFYLCTIIACTCYVDFINLAGYIDLC